MAKVIAGMTVSLDGFVEDEDGRAGRLYTDLDALQGTPYMNSRDRGDRRRPVGPADVRDGGPGLLGRCLRVPGAHLRTHP